MPKRTYRKLYIDKNELRERAIEARAAVLAGKQASDAFGKLLIQLATHIAGGSQFARYESEVKSDLISSGICYAMRCIRYLKEDFDAKQFFNFITKSVYFGFVKYLKAYYKEKNLKRDMLIKQLLQIQAERNLTSVEQQCLNDNLAMKYDLEHRTEKLDVCSTKNSRECRKKNE